MGQNLKKFVKGDKIDQKVQQALFGMLSRARSKLMKAVAKKVSFGGISYRKFKTPDEVAADAAVEEMFESGSIAEEFSYLKGLNTGQLESTMVGLIPVIRLAEGKYLVGSEVKAM